MAIWYRIYVGEDADDGVWTRILRAPHCHPHMPWLSECVLMVPKGVGDWDCSE